MITICLGRHGNVLGMPELSETGAKFLPVLVGRNTDLNNGLILTEEARRKARLMGANLWNRRVTLAATFASPEFRCAETAAHIMLGNGMNPRVTTVPEIGGASDGKHPLSPELMAELKRVAAANYDGDIVMAAMLHEPVQEIMMQRGREGADWLLELVARLPDGSTIVLVSHTGGRIEHMLSVLSGTPVKNLPMFNPLEFAKLTFEDGAYKDVGYDALQPMETIPQGEDLL